jgi:flagellar biosynthesis anti-sigma factor FlgM
MMRIDSAVPLPESQSTSQANSTGTPITQSSTVSVASAQDQDQAQLSLDTSAMQSLRTLLSQVPEVRQSRVDALRQSVNSGGYQLSDQQLGEAIGSDLFAGQLQVA